MSRRVVIVGAGPKALFALERLVAEVRASPGGGEELVVDVFDPCTPGAGPAYDPGLDPALLMNLRAELIDAWPRTGDAAIAEDDAHPSFMRWARPHGVGADAYVQRALVGRYLAACWSRVVADGGADVIIRHHAEVVADVSATTAGWSVRSGDGRVVASDVLLATGHGAPEAGDPRMLPLDRLAECREVGVLGAGLTALDLVRGCAARRARGAEVARLHLVSRTGRPPVPKPAPSIDRAWRAQLTERARPAVGPLTTISALRETLVRDAATLMGHREAGEVAAALEAIERREPMDHAAATHALGAWLEAAESPEAHPALALGAAWRWRYPRLVADAGRGAMGARELTAFRALAAAMELVAFGPPVEAAATLHAALSTGEARIWSAPARIAYTAGRPSLHLPDGSRRPLDAAVDARQRLPGAGNSPITQRLVAAGALSVVPGGRGIRTAEDAAALDPRGDRVPGLAVIGRATEDWVIGNDTLDRALHDDAARWAEALVHAGDRARVLA